MMDYTYVIYISCFDSFSFMILLRGSTMFLKK